MKIPTSIQLVVSMMQISPGSSMPPKKPLHLGTVFIYFLIHMT